MQLRAVDTALTREVVDGIATSSTPISDNPYLLELQASARAEQSLGWSKGRKLSAADVAALRQKADKEVVKLRDQISDPAKRPTLDALRQAIEGSIFFGEECRAENRDAAWFSKNRGAAFAS